MKCRPSIILILLISVALSGCNSKPLTPEKVIREYVAYMNDGDCERAKSLCVEGALELVEAQMNMGCETYQVTYATEVISCDCETREDVTRCLCLENIDGMKMSVPYALKLVDGEWKLFDLSKDSAPWEWVEQNH